jgi:hypothetical protein
MEGSVISASPLPKAPPMRPSGKQAKVEGKPPEVEGAAPTRGADQGAFPNVGLIMKMLGELLDVKPPLAARIYSALGKAAKDGEGLTRKEWNAIMERFGFRDLKMESDAFAALACGSEDTSAVCKDINTAIRRMNLTAKAMQPVLRGSLRQVLARYAQHNDGFYLVGSKKQMQAIKEAFKDIKIFLKRYPKLKQELEKIEGEDKKWEYVTFQVIFPMIFGKIGVEEDERPLEIMNDMLEKVEEDPQAYRRYVSEIHYMSRTGMFDYERVIYGNKPDPNVGGNAAPVKLGAGGAE